MSERASRGRLLAVVVAAGLMLVGCSVLEGVDETRPDSAPEATRSSSSTGSPMPVYWLGDSGTRTYLYREYLPYEAVDAAAPGDVIATAVATMAAGSPRDPDYRNPWHEAERVGANVSRNGTITVDVSESMFNHEISEAEARSALQQLIFTATAAAANSGMDTGGPTTPVIITVDGRSGYRYGGTILGSPMVRDEARQAPLWVIDPAYGRSADAEVSFKMVASHVARTVYWDIRRVADDELVFSGQIELDGAEARQQEIQFTRRLVTGEYTVRLYVLNQDVMDTSLINPQEAISLWDDHEFSVS